MTGASITQGQRVRVALRDDVRFLWLPAVVLQPELPDGTVGVIVPGEFFARALRPEQVFAGATFSCGLLSVEQPAQGKA